VAGAGSGALLPSQPALVASLVSSELRHRATAVSRVAANLGVGLGAVLGGIVAARGLNGFVGLFLLNAVTYLLYSCILVAVVREAPRPEPVPGGYLTVLRDRAFIRLTMTNIAMIAVGWGVFTWIVPAYASGDLGLSSRLIGIFVFANAVTVVLVQIPVARLAEGAAARGHDGCRRSPVRRRLRACRGRRPARPGDGFGGVTRCSSRGRHG
jgi:MFS family permease